MEKVLNILKNPIVITLLIIVIGVGGIVGLVRLFPDNAATSVSYVERSWGKQDSTVTVVEYADFQCPGCANFATTVEKQLKENYGDRIKYVYKHFPLTSLHRNAQKAAEASEAAGAQGKFWEYHDLLFSRQAEAETWNIDRFTSYAQELGLDTTRFRQELIDNIYRQAVKDSINEADAKGYTGTPTLEINGKKFEPTPGSVPTYEDISKELDKLLAAAPSPTPTTQATATTAPTATPGE
jgi:protein-disulfide isomerase